MLIIPVIDLLDGKVVHAKQGNRSHYQAIQSNLTSTCEPLAVANALLNYYPFRQLYIADLNAIQHIGEHHLSTIKQIAQAHPELTLWVDAGIRTRDDLAVWNNSHFNLILGSENFSSHADYLDVSQQLQSRFMLSLDFMPQGYQGPKELLENSHYWPQDVILMSLAHVGAHSGINMALINEFAKHSTQFNLYAAGGVRNIADLIELKQLNIHGALVASALHQQQISPIALEQIQK